MRKELKQMFDDFDTQIQIEEIIPEEWEDWLLYCAEENARKEKEEI